MLNPHSELSSLRPPALPPPRLRHAVFASAKNARQLRQVEELALGRMTALLQNLDDDLLTPIGAVALSQNIS